MQEKKTSLKSLSGKSLFLKKRYESIKYMHRQQQQLLKRQQPPGVLKKYKFFLLKTSDLNPYYKRINLSVQKHLYIRQFIR